MTSKTKKAPAKQARAKQTTRKAAAKQAETKPAGPRWSIGLFRNDKGRLVTVYVNADGQPVPYEAKRVGDRPILFHQTYSGMPYREARQELLKDAAKAGHESEGKEPKAKAKKASSKGKTIDRACSYCGAAAGELCRTKSGEDTESFHAARTKAPK